LFNGYHGFSLWVMWRTNLSLIEEFSASGLCGLGWDL
jgi:hypothetical protein